MGVSINRGYPQSSSISNDGIFPSKPSIWADPCVKKLGSKSSINLRTFALATFDDTETQYCRHWGGRACRVCVEAPAGAPHGDSPLDLLGEYRDSSIGSL